tara:strand:- start:681 stop:1115 length:435 start_codon:yes stop_codon:yes gene_type:complete
MTKQAGGVMIPASDMEAEKLTKFKTGEMYEVKLKYSRNPKFHRKVFLFFNYCFEFWDGNTVYEHFSNEMQFNTFRKDLTILAGFYITTTRLNGDTRIEAESLSFETMEQERFEQVYKALIQAAMKHIFGRDDDNAIYNRLVRFF